MKSICTFILLATVIFLTAGCTTSQSIYKKRLEEARGLALSRCIAYMNKSVDSLSPITKDHSIGYFVEFGHLTLHEIVQINDFVKDEFMNFQGIAKDKQANMIGYSAWQFYHSKTLADFIRKTIRRKPDEGKEE